MDRFIEKYGDVLQQHLSEKWEGITVTNVYEPTVTDMVKGYVQYNSRPLLAVHYRQAKASEQEEQVEDKEVEPHFVQYITDSFLHKEVINVQVERKYGQYYTCLYVEAVDQPLYVPLHVMEEHVDEKGDPDGKQIPNWITKLLGLTVPEPIIHEEVTEPTEPTDKY
ncbi:hypothetical protein [Pontibacillus litoralis]|uniref:Uncharacterized protein n=1 Tax=Pontibacillus litoralis JSM 072002 TaxID=1385512 RepID=A0A0A5GB00_9BACI|nr:hypothetical protein [Pontibacillus litoralis]KGX89209.1 hypothetical protein N784_01665 [Pontibacillus litoralis JSM 072002]